VDRANRVIDEVSARLDAEFENLTDA
jgi:hypothetical protein